jgi:intracellular sulfur oxidation DsrE/DsrF family protein
LAVSDNRNPDNKTAAEIVDEIMANLVPGAIAIPAAVFELVRLQERGYHLVVNH